MRRLLLACTTFCTVAVLAACQSNPGVDTSLAPTSTDIVGSFNLTTANGRVPPYQAIVTTTEVWTLVSDKIVIAANNTWADTTNYDITNRADGTETSRGTASAGTWSIANNQINFTMTTGGAVNFTGSVSGNQLTTIFEGARYYYSR